MQPTSHKTDDPNDIKIHLIETLMRADCPLNAKQYGSLMTDDYCELTAKQTQVYEDAFVLLN